MDYGVIIDRLNEVAKIIRDNPKKSFPLWVFELDSCSKDLAYIYKIKGIALGYSGKLKVDIPQLRPLKNAITRLSRLSAVGGLSFSIDVVYQTISSAIEDLKLQEKLEGGG
ncbi:MAG: hypothetical protein ACOY30_00340 [Bacillota bacterium]